MNKNIRYIFIGLFGAYLGQSILSPVFSPLVREMGLSEFHGGLILSSAALMWSIASPFWGKKSEQWGRKPVFIIGLLGYGFASLIFGAFSKAGLNGLYPLYGLLLLLMLARVLVGLLLSASPTSALAYVADRYDGKERTRSIAFISAAMGLGTILGPAFGGAVVRFGLVAPIFFAAIIALLGGILNIIFLEPSHKRSSENSTGSVKMFDIRIRSYLVIGFFVFLTLSISQIVIGFYFQDRLLLTAKETAEKVGFAFMLKGFAVVITQMWLVRILKFSPIKLLKIGIPLVFISFIVFIFATNYGLLILAIVVMGFGLGFIQPGFYSSTSFAVKDNEQGAVAGLSSSVLAFSSVLGQSLGGAFYQLSPLVPFIISAAVILISLILIYNHKSNLSNE